MSDVAIDWIARFFSQCALNYSTISVVTALVCFVMALVLLLVRQQVLRAEQWLLYLGLAFATFTLQYAGRTAAVWLHSKNLPALAEQIKDASQAIFSNLNSLFFLLAALALLYRLPNSWWRSRWQGLIWLFAASALLGLALDDPARRFLDGGLSAVCLGVLSWAMYASSGTRHRRRLALFNLAGGMCYAGLQIIYIFSPSLSTQPRVVNALHALQKVEPYKSAAIVLPKDILDYGLFGVAFLLKVTLFVAALLVVMRCLAAFAPGRDILRPMKKERGEFLSSRGIVQKIGESIGADSAALYFRLPSTKANRLQFFQWWNDSARTAAGDSLPRPLPDHSILGQTLGGEEDDDDIISSPDTLKDPRFRGFDPLEAGAGMRSFLNVRLRYHGAVIGSLSFAWRQTAGFTATDVQRARQIGDFVTPVVQTERWLRAVSTLRQRLQHYEFPQQDRDRGTIIARVANELQDVLSPIGTLLVIDFGFAAQWAFSETRTTSSDDAGEKRTFSEIQYTFTRLINGLEARCEEMPVGFDDYRGEKIAVGKIVLASHSVRDLIDRPSLTQDKQQLSAMADLVKDVMFDLHRKRFSGIVHRLHGRLNTEVETESQWVECVCEALTDAGLKEAVLTPGKSRLSRDRLPGITIPREALGPAEMHGGYPIHSWRSPDGVQQAVLELRLSASEVTLFVVIPRAGFGPELDAELPWKLFFDRLSGAADSALVRIRAVDLEGSAIQFEMTDLLVHELRTPAAEFEFGCEEMASELGLNASQNQLALLASLQNSAAKFLELADVILDPFRRDNRRIVALQEVMERVLQFYLPRLPVGKIQLRIDRVDPRWAIKVPFPLAYVVLVSLIRNSKEAIGSRVGWIRVTAEVDSDTILVHVDDNGPGVAEEERDKIFIMGHSSKGGSGRGLPLARRALYRYNGDLFLANAPADVSARFSILFPMELS